MQGGVRFRREYFLRCSGTNLAMNHFRREFRAFGLGGTWGDMAVRGAFAVRRQGVVASFVRNLLIDAACHLRDTKSTQSFHPEHGRSLAVSFAVKSSKYGTQCLDVLRGATTSGDDSLLKSLGV